MKKILAILILIFTQILFAQNTEGYGFAIIDDKDGFTNVREEPNVKSKIVGKIKEGELFYNRFIEHNSDWIEVETEENLSGYVHVSRIKFLNNLKQLKYRKEAKDTLTIYQSNIKVQIFKSAFILKEHKIERKEYNPVSKIDQKHPWGVDGTLPTQAIQSIQITLGQNVLEMPKNELDDLFEPNFEQTRVFVGKNDTYYLTMSNSDGAGGYRVTFVIRKGKFVKRYIFIPF
jgi:Bacterial SH3 domain